MKYLILLLPLALLLTISCAKPPDNVYYNEQPPVTAPSECDTTFYYQSGYDQGLRHGYEEGYTQALRDTKCHGKECGKGKGVDNE